MLEICELAPGLSEIDDGVWAAPSTARVSFPEDGNAWFRELEENSFWFSHRNRCIVAAVRRFPPNGAVFDVGGGNGYVANGLREAGFDAVLVEPGIEAARAGRSRGLRPVICATLEDARFREASVPAAGLFDVLEHIEDAERFLRLLNSLLVPVARLYITVPAYTWLWSYYDEHMGHFRRYTRRSLAEILRTTGFETEYSTFFFSPLPPAIFALRSAPTRLGLRRATSFEHQQIHHGGSRGPLIRYLERGLGLELRAIASGRTIPFGTSYLAVARTQSPR